MSARPEPTRFDQVRARRRSATEPAPVHVLHVLVGEPIGPAGHVGAAVEAAGRGHLVVTSVVGLGRALDHLAAHPVALALLQSVHPGVAGAALSELKHAHAALPVVLVTDQSDDAAVVAAVRAGAEDCLTQSEATGSRLVRAIRCALERTSHAASLRTQAVTDPLTGLPNRQALQRALEHAIARARRHARTFAVLFVDLDGFKAVNDRCGHDGGDRVLRVVSTRFRRRTRDMDTIARVGGDEFVVVMEDLDDGRFAATLASKLLSAAAEPVDLDGVPTALTASVGIGLYPGDGEDPATLLRHADAAMYAAKAAGKQQYRYYRARMNEHTRARTVLDQALERALLDGELDVHYQPVWQASARRIVSCEALVRWRRPGHGLQAPAEFLDGLEQAGLSGRLAATVIGAACTTARRMQDAGFSLPVSVNLSRRQLTDGAVAAALARGLAHAGLDPSAIHVEVGETVMGTDDPRLDAALHEIGSMGVPLVLDDVGGGPVSLQTLSRARATMLKVAAALTEEHPTRKEAKAVFSAIVALARTLGVRVVAKGVETEADARAVGALGCDLLQGYLYGHALPADEWMSYLRWACTAVVGTDGAVSTSRRTRPAGYGGGPRSGVVDMPRGLPTIPGPALTGVTARGDVVVGPFGKH
jgi:diguanylate cyclase (GGDEF)-like protein